MGNKEDFGYKSHAVKTLLDVQKKIKKIRKAG